MQCKRIVFKKIDRSCTFKYKHKPIFFRSIQIKIDSNRSKCKHGLRGHLSYKITFSMSQRWPLNTGLTVSILCMKSIFSIRCIEISFELFCAFISWYWLHNFLSNININCPFYVHKYICLCGLKSFKFW